MIRVFQDGREFYDADNGNVIFIASEPVKDGDIEAAMIAEDEFVKWTIRIDLDWDWD